MHFTRDVIYSSPIYLCVMALINTTRGQRSERCPNCNLPMQWCFCSNIETEDVPTRIILLRHPKEKFRSSGTGFLPGLCLKKFQIVEPEELELQLKGLEGPVALLFPPDGDSDGRLPEYSPNRMDGLKTLIVPDGSWSEARRMVRRSPELRQLPRVSPPMGDRWLATPLRQDKWNRPCTAEAIGHWLINEGCLGAANQLRQVLVQFVEAHWRARGRFPLRESGD